MQISVHALLLACVAPVFSTDLKLNANHSRIATVVAGSEIGSSNVTRSRNEFFNDALRIFGALSTEANALSTAARHLIEQERIFLHQFPTGLENLYGFPGIMMELSLGRQESGSDVILRYLENTEKVFPILMDGTDLLVQGIAKIHHDIAEATNGILMELKETDTGIQ